MSEQRGRYRKSERLRSLEINDQLELGRLLDRQIGGPFTFEDAADVDASLARRLDGLGP
jgi:hypothetical protein